MIIDDDDDDGSNSDEDDPEKDDGDDNDDDDDDDDQFTLPFFCPPLCSARWIFCRHRRDGFSVSFLGL